MSLHEEWKFVQYITPIDGTLFAPLQMASGGGFIPYLLRGGREEVTDYLCNMIIWVVKREGIGIPDPTQTAPVNFEMS